MSGDGLWLDASSLFSKWGFNDGDEPEALLDLCDELGHPYPNDWHSTLRILVHTRLLPALPGAVEVYDIETNHNPIRARAVNGLLVDEAVELGQNMPREFEPGGVLIPWDEVLAVAAVSRNPKNP